MLFLRVAPVLPNWFITVSSPIVGVPLRTFALATFIGLIPGNYVMLSTGLSLNALSEPGPIITPKSLLSMFAVGCVALVPLVAKRFLDKGEAVSGSADAEGLRLLEDAGAGEESEAEAENALHVE
jgi:uncharacterized membrane protein YdjX (TVP38/TMEM64 family)